MELLGWYSITEVELITRLDRGRKRGLITAIRGRTRGETPSGKSERITMSIVNGSRTLGVSDLWMSIALVVRSESSRVLLLTCTLPHAVFK